MLIWISVMPKSRIGWKTFFLKDIQVEILSQLLWSQKVTNIMRNNSLGIVNIQSVFNASLLFVDKSLTEGPNNCWWHLQARLQAEQEKNMMDWHKQEHRKWGTGRNDEGKGVGAGSISSDSLPVLHCGKKREKPIYFFLVHVRLSHSVFSMVWYLLICSGRQNLTRV